jgi:Domain of unknown function (DUF4440)
MTGPQPSSRRPVAAAAYHLLMSTEPVEQELIQVERRGWDALCSDNAATYYREHLTEDALMAFPFGLMDREEALRAMAAAEPWSRYDMQDPRVVSLGPDAGVVVYTVTAQRQGQEPFTAVLSSTFVRRDGEWKTAFHQQSFQ